MDKELEEAIERVRWRFKHKYNVDLKDLEITDSRGYWRDKEEKMHYGHPLHSCLFCSGPFKASYRFHDYSDASSRDSKGRWLSPYRTWKLIYEATKKGII